MPRLFSALVAVTIGLPLSQLTQALLPEAGFSDLAKEYGPWAAISVVLGYMLIRDKQALTNEIKEVRNYQRDVLQGLVTDTKVALEKVAERIEGCPLKGERKEPD